MSFKKIKDFFENNQFIILRYTFIVYAMIILKGFERPIVDLITSHYPKWLNLAFLLIQDTLWINWATFILTIIISLYLLYCLLRKKDGVAGITLLLVLFFIFSYRDFTPLKFIDLPFSNRVNYRLLFDILLCLIFVIGSFKHGHYQIPNKKRDVPSENKNLQDVGWNEYALKLVEKVQKLDSEESFAIGVSGTWGSGKTTFLKHIKDNLKDDKFIVIDFEPWSCIDSNQIIQEFFKKLSDNFKSSHKQLLKDVKSYAKMISHFDDSLWISKASDIFFRSDESLSNTKKQLEAEIDRIDKKIIIFIDDLDRLGNEELYEVLKLIRVTANFKNIIYIVAYDTTYVGKLLEDYGGSSFLKKIINLEISLPGYEEYHLPTILYDELKKLNINEEYLKLIKPAIFQQTNQGYLVTKYLSCFRDVKRFAQIFTLNLNQITSKLSTLNIDLYDFFLIELLHYSYPETYNILKENPDNLLNTNLGYHYTVKNQPGSTNKHESNNNSTGSIPNKVWVLLHFIFGDNPNHKSNSIQNVESFYEYFYYRNQNDKLSIEDYNKILNANSDQEIEEIVKEWCINKIMLSPLSINKRFVFEKTEKYDETKAKNYLSALVKFSRYYPSIANKILKIKLFKQDYNYDLEQALNAFIKVIITNEMKENTNYLTWPVIFNNIVAKTHNNGTVHINAPLLSNVDIKGLFDEYFNFWMDNINFKKMFDFKEIFNPDSDVFKILESSVVFGFITDNFYEKDVLLNKENIFKLLQCDKEETFTEYNNNLHEYYVNNTGDKESLYDCVKTLFATKDNYIEFIDTCVSGVNPETIMKHKEEIFGKPTTNVPFNRQNQNSR